MAHPIKPWSSSHHQAFASGLRVSHHLSGHLRATSGYSLTAHTVAPPKLQVLGVDGYIWNL